MNYSIIMKSGASFEVTEETKENLIKQLLKARDNRPQFILIKEIETTINTDAVSFVAPNPKNSW